MSKDNQKYAESIKEENEKLKLHIRELEALLKECPQCGFNLKKFDELERAKE